MPQTSDSPLRAEGDLSEPKVNILLVDDQPANLLALQAILEDLGHNLIEAISGEEALRFLLTGDFAVVLLDVQMQGLDGFETAKLIRNRERCRHIPIIFLTAYESNRLPVEEAYSLGAVDYLVKPLVPSILRAKVAWFVELFQKSEQVKRQAEQIRRMERQEFERSTLQAVRALRESEVRKTAIVEAALDCIVTMDHQGRIVEFNPAAERTFGYRQADVLGLQMSDLLVPPSLREKHKRGLARYLCTGEGPVVANRVEMPALRSDGTEFPVELAVTRITSEGPPLFTAYVRDITERRRAESRRNVRLAVTQVLAEAASIQEAARNFLQAACNGLGWDVGAMWTLDRQANVLRCLDVWHAPLVRVEEFESVTRQTAFSTGVGLPGRVWQSGKPDWIPDVTQDSNFPRAPFALAKGLHGAFGCPILLGTEFLGVIEFFSQQIREPNADLLEMMATIGGQIGQFLERKRAEAVLRDSEQRFARFMQQLPGLAWIKDPQGRYVYANDAAMKIFSRSRDEIYARTDEEIFPPETAAQFKENDQRARESDKGVQVIETLEHEDGIHHSLVSKFPIPGPSGEGMLVGGMAINITDRLRAEEALKEADRLKDEFLAMLAHELRNPLAPIRNALHIMKQPDPSEAMGVQVLDMAERQVQHMARLLDDLLDVSRISRGSIELRREVVDMRLVMDHTVEAVRPLFEERRHELTISLPSESLVLKGDQARLEQVVTNLLNNSCKYTDPGGHIWLIAERQGKEAVVRVRDSGRGIAAELLPRVFDLFVQAERGLDRSQGGVGIGLTLVKKLVELHGGSIVAHSDGKGKGSEFVVRLPVLTSAEHRLETQCNLVDEPKKIPRRRILVVDDNKDAATTLAMLLKLAGQEVQTANDGLSALQVAESFQPELVVLDIGMPGMDGYEVARRLRQRPEHQQTVLIALTRWGQDEDRKRSKEAGFNHHLVKPVEPKVLTKLLADCQ